MKRSLKTEARKTRAKAMKKTEKVSKIHPLVFDAEWHTSDTVARFITPEYVNTLEKIKVNTGREKGKETYNVAASFDIEASSWLEGERKLATMYIWQFCIDGKVFYGRKWDEFQKFVAYLKDVMKLDATHVLPVYVHNLSYEFQWICHWFDFFEVFATGPRTPVRACCNEGIEFRDSYVMTQKSLAKLAGDIHKYTQVGDEKIKKMVGDLDYGKVRHSETPLTKEEMRYAMFDVYTLTAYIHEQIEIEGNVNKIPMTKTGYVRRRCCNATVNQKNESKAWKYRDIMGGLKLTPEEYNDLRDNVFQGGFTHANAQWADCVMRGIKSYDFTSSYPAVMVMEKFPSGKAGEIRKPTAQQFANALKTYCCYFRVEFTNIRSRIDFEHFISKSRCKIDGDCVIDNGRVVRADKLTTWVTERDWFIYRKAYKADKVVLKSPITLYYKKYLPTDLVNVVLSLYEGKTKLKDDEKKAFEYALLKADLNSTYGMMVTDIIKETVEWLQDKQEWHTGDGKDIENGIEAYNNSWKRFLYYPWGVWVTAYARYNLCRGILACGEYYRYSDTDSIKYQSPAPEFEKWVEQYNEEVADKMRAAMRHHGFDENRWKPKTLSGEEKPLGFWDFDGEYIEFKTLGAKRYCFSKKNKKKKKESVEEFEKRREENRGIIIDEGPDWFITFHVTVAGSNKKKTALYLCERYRTPFEGFKFGLEIPPEKSGKLGATYLDHDFGAECVDYLGNRYTIYERSAINMVPIGFTMTNDDYIDYLMNELKLARPIAHIIEQ